MAVRDREAPQFGMKSVYWREKSGKMASRGCLRSADAFCYVCGHFIKTRARKYSMKACRKMCEAYKAYFGMPVGDQDKSWAPHVTCEYCKKTLEGWYRGEKRAMKFAIPRIWREPTDHSNNCYFCMVEPTKRRTGKNAPQIVYPDLPSSIAPVPHCPQLPVPTPPTRDRSFRRQQQSDSEEDTGDLECDFTDADDEKRPYFPNRKDINDLIRDLGLTKSNAELLTSRLKQWNLLDESVQVTEQRSRHQTVSIFFRQVLGEDPLFLRSKQYYFCFKGMRSSPKLVLKMEPVVQIIKYSNGLVQVQQYGSYHNKHVGCGAKSPHNKSALTFRGKEQADKTMYGNLAGLFVNEGTYWKILK
ncbi:LOW QUALITY PROTEIN: uncharacterized protein ACMZJ9_009581 [Mantella aurantiaca]